MIAPKRVLFRLILLLVQVWPVWAQTTTLQSRPVVPIKLSPQEQAYFQSHPVIRTQSEADFPPYDFSVGGEPQGYSIDLLNLLAQHIGVKVEYVSGHTWAEFVLMHRQGKLDLLHSLVTTPDRESAGIFSEPYARTKTVFLKGKETPDITGFDQLAGKTVAVGRGWAQEEFFEKNYPKIKLLRVNTIEQMLESVSSGAAHATLEGDAAIEYWLRKKGMTDLKPSGWAKEFDQGVPQTYRFYARRADQPLITALDKALALLTPAELEGLQLKWFGGVAANATEQSMGLRIELTETERAYLVAKSEIRMCAFPDWPPFERINENGEHEGIAADVMGLIRERLGVRFVLHPTRTFAESHEAIRQHKCDILPMWYDLPYYKDFLSFSKPYLRQTFVVATQSNEIFVKDASEIGEHVVGVSLGNPVADLLRARFPSINMVEVQNVKEGLDKVSDGSFWGYIDGMPTIAYMLQKHGLMNLKIAGKIDMDLALSIASRNDDPLLAGIMQKAATSIGETESRAIVNRWVSVRYEQGFDYSLFWKLGFGMLVLMLGFYVWNRKLAKVNRQLDVTQATLRAATTELETILKNAWIGVFVTNGEGKIVRMNDYCESVVFQCQSAAYIGQSTRALFPSQSAYGKFTDEVRLAGMPNVSVELSMCRKGGAPFLAKVTGSLIDPNDDSKGAIWLMTDITEQRAAEDKLARTLYELEIIFSHVGIGIAYTKDRQLMRVNRILTDMLGYKDEELVGQPSRMLYPSDEVYQLVGRGYSALDKGEVFRVEVPLLRADGSEFRGELVGCRVDPQHPGKGDLWTFQDVTELRQAQVDIQFARDDALAKSVLIAQQHGTVVRTLNQITTLLDNSGQGFLTVGKDMQVGEGFSLECRRIFGRKQLDLPLPELLCPADVRQQQFLQKTLVLVLQSGQDELRRAACIDLLPAEYQLGDHYYQAEYKLLDGERMMLILTDVTDQKQLRERLDLERRCLEFVVNALANHDDLLEVLRDFDTFRSSTLPDLLSFEHQPRVLLAEIFRQLHTFKSLFAQACLPTIPAVLHALESRLGHLQDLADKVDTNAIKHELGTCDLGDALEKDLAILREKLGESYFGSELKIRIAATQLAALEEHTSTLYGADSPLLEMIHRLRFVPLESLIAPHFRAAEQLAERQEKLLAPVRYQGDKALVDPDTFGPFCKTLLHLFRNAVDHGIEDADTRLLADKPEMATIRCEVRTGDNQLHLSIADDGCGIDVARVRSKAMEAVVRQKMPDLDPAFIAAMGQQAVLQLIFADGLSTRDEVSAISGRGMGLSAVREELLRIGGSVQVRTAAGKGTQFEFALPYQSVPRPEDMTNSTAEVGRFLLPLQGVLKAHFSDYLKLVVSLDENLQKFTVESLLDFTVLVPLGLGLNANASIGLSIDRPLLTEMTRRFEPGFSDAEVDELAEGVGAEIANTLAGNATVYFTHLQRRVVMGTPQIIAPQERMLTIGGHPFHGFTASTEAGSLLVFWIVNEEGTV